jgi:hypothetical protein
MSDRPIHQETDPEVSLPTPQWVRPPMRITKEQLAAAERTRDFHVRKLQQMVKRLERSSETGSRGEH